MATAMLTQEYIRECLNYDSDTGLFLWAERPQKHFRTLRGWRTFNSQKAGKGACCLSGASGYRAISLNKRHYQAHRIAFLYMGGDMPKEIDHINHIRSDNRWVNLRAVTRTQNKQNVKLYANNTSGVCGVTRNKKNWMASINVCGTSVHLGTYPTIEEAARVRAAANIKYGFHENHGSGSY